VKVELVKTVVFEAAHRLPNLPPGHKCGRLHGHSYRVDLHVEGVLSEQTGWVMDYADVGRAFAPLMEVLDHSFLNEIDGLSIPTSENVARWIWDRLVDALPGLSQVVVHETSTARCVYRGVGRERG